MDNARLHNANVLIQFFEQNRMKPMHHPRHSPGLALSDIYLFGSVNRRPRGFLFEGTKQLPQAVQTVLEDIEGDPASGLSRVDGPFAEKYPCQWRVY
jgi:hypothetical protein